MKTLEEKLQERKEERQAIQERRNAIKKEHRRRRAQKKRHENSIMEKLGYCIVCDTKLPKGTTTQTKYCSQKCKNHAQHLRDRVKTLGEPLKDKTFRTLQETYRIKNREGYAKELRSLSNLAFLADFEIHGIKTIEKVREESPSKYLDIIMKLLPEEKNISVEHSFVDLLREANRDERVIEVEPERLN